MSSKLQNAARFKRFKEFRDLDDPPAPPARVMDFEIYALDKAYEAWLAAGDGERISYKHFEEVTNGRMRNIVFDWLVKIIAPSFLEMADKQQLRAPVVADPKDHNVFYIIKHGGKGVV
jgi:hypothetical protein